MGTPMEGASTWQKLTWTRSFLQDYHRSCLWTKVACGLVLIGGTNSQKVERWWACHWEFLTDISRPLPPSPLLILSDHDLIWFTIGFCIWCRLCQLNNLCNVSLFYNSTVIQLPCDRTLSSDLHWGSQFICQVWNNWSCTFLGLTAYIYYYKTIHSEIHSWITNTKIRFLKIKTFYFILTSPGSAIPVSSFSFGTSHMLLPKALIFLWIMTLQ